MFRRENCARLVHFNSDRWRMVYLLFYHEPVSHHDDATVFPSKIRVDNQNRHCRPLRLWRTCQMCGRITHERVLSVTAPAKTKLIHVVLIGRVAASATDKSDRSFPGFKQIFFPTMGTVIPTTTVHSDLLGKNYRTHSDLGGVL